MSPFNACGRFDLYIGRSHLPEHLLLRDTLYLLQGISGKYIQFTLASSTAASGEITFSDDPVGHTQIVKMTAYQFSGIEICHLASNQSPLSPFGGSRLSLYARRHVCTRARRETRRRDDRTESMPSSSKPTDRILQAGSCTGVANVGECAAFGRI